MTSRIRATPYVAHTETPPRTTGYARTFNIRQIGSRIGAASCLITLCRCMSNIFSYFAGMIQRLLYSSDNATQNPNTHIDPSYNIIHNNKRANTGSSEDEKVLYVAPVPIRIHKNPRLNKANPKRQLFSSILTSFDSGPSDHLYEATRDYLQKLYTQYTNTFPDNKASPHTANHNGIMPNTAFLAERTNASDISIKEKHMLREMLQWIQIHSLICIWRIDVKEYKTKRSEWQSGKTIQQLKTLYKKPFTRDMLRTPTMLAKFFLSIHNPIQIWNHYSDSGGTFHDFSEHSGYTHLHASYKRCCKLLAKYGVPINGANIFDVVRNDPKYIKIQHKTREIFDKCRISVFIPHYIEMYSAHINRNHNQYTIAISKLSATIHDFINSRSTSTLTINHEKMNAYISIAGEMLRTALVPAITKEHKLDREEVHAFEKGFRLKHPAIWISRKQWETLRIIDPTRIIQSQSVNQIQKHA